MIHLTHLKGHMSQVDQMQNYKDPKKKKIKNKLQEINLLEVYSAIGHISKFEYTFGVFYFLLEAVDIV